MTKHFLSCDWGTSSFRIRLADARDGKVLAEETSGQGIAQTFDLWQQTGGPAEERTSFYLGVIRNHIRKLEEQTARSLNDVKVIVSGMASSSIGMIEVPYAAVPLPLDGSGLKTESITADETFEHDVLIISGVRTANDVMRGEETQLIGCIEDGGKIKNELYIFPGTHSKHITIKDNLVTDIKTYMTGELFALLSEKSILKNAVEPGGEFGADSFLKGVKQARTENLLHHIFTVRTNQLFDICDKTENYAYLSGSLIGAELNALVDCDANIIHLVSSGNLARYYQAALKELLPAGKINIFSDNLADRAPVMGQIKIGGQLNIL